MKKRYTLIYYQSFGYRAGQYVTRMRRIETKNLDNYLKRYAYDLAFIFEGWPKLEGEK